MLSRFFPPTHQFLPRFQFYAAWHSKPVLVFEQSKLSFLKAEAVLILQKDLISVNSSGTDMGKKVLESMQNWGGEEGGWAARRKDKEFIAVDNARRKLTGGKRWWPGTRVSRSWMPKVVYLKWILL